MPAAHSSLAHACAECKRLKLKCDKQQPCGACVRRGCAEICPDGSLVAGRGTRFILSNTKELHEEVDTLRVRVKDLEQALAELQSQLTPEPHPLLKQSLKVVSETLQPVEQDPKADALEDEALIDTFGSLTIDSSGQTTWYGPHAGSEFFIPRTEPSSIGDQADVSLDLPIDLMLLSKLFPLKSLDDGIEVVRARVRALIPPESIAYDATFTFHSRLAWSTSPQGWEDFLENVFKPIYTTNDANDQQVGILFIILAISILLDPSRPISHPDTKKYYHLSRVSVQLGEDLLHSRSLLAIQYLQLVAFYNGVANEPNGTNRAWVATSIAIRLAQMAGLHRDNPQWDLYPEQAERRRRIWWELLAFETMQGFAMGRPRAINPVHFDTKMPHDEEDDGKPPSFNRTKYHWIAEGLGAILDEAFAVKPPSYATTLKLDKTIRDWKLDSIPSVDDVPLVNPIDINHKFMVILMRSFATTGLREISLMYLHRRYFIEALTRRPDEPLRSKYAMSVLAVHRSSVLLLQGIQRLDGLIGKLLPKILFMWLHGLSAYVCLCAIVIKSPGCCLSRSCLVEIDRTKDLFARVSAYRMSHAQPAISKLYDQAHMAMNLYREGKWPPNEQHIKSCAGGYKDVDVMRFVGKSGFVAMPDPRDTAAQTPDTTAGGSPPNMAHPLLFEYLKRFQTEPESENGSSTGPPSSIGFPPEQSMLPPIMSGFEGMTFSDPFASSPVSSLPETNGHTNGFTAPFDPVLVTAPPNPMEWTGMSSAYGNGYIPENFNFNSMGAYMSDEAAAFGMSNFEPTGQIPDQAWQNFLTGLIPQDSSVEITALETDLLKS